MGLKYWINANSGCAIIIFVKGAHNVQSFLSHFFLKISETLKARISEMEEDINKQWTTAFSS